MSLALISREKHQYILKMLAHVISRYSIRPARRKMHDRFVLADALSLKVGIAMRIFIECVARDDFHQEIDMIKYLCAGDKCRRRMAQQALCEA